MFEYEEGLSCYGCGHSCQSGTPCYSQPVCVVCSRTPNPEMIADWLEMRNTILVPPIDMYISLERLFMEKRSFSSEQRPPDYLYPSYSASQS